MSFLPFTAFYAAICGLILVMLSAQVINQRRKGRVALGDGGHPGLMRAIRVQANFVEYAPLSLIVLGLLEMSGGAPVWAIHLLGAALVLGRLLHAQGLGSKPGESFGRMAGMILTFTMLVVASVWLLAVALPATLQ